MGQSSPYRESDSDPRSSRPSEPFPDGWDWEDEEVTEVIPPEHLPDYRGASYS